MADIEVELLRRRTDGTLVPWVIEDDGDTPVDTGLQQPLTDAQLRAAAVPVSGTVEVMNDAGNPLPVSGTVTANTGLVQPLTDSQLRAAAVPVAGPLTDTQLRASAVSVSGTVSTGLTQPLTDTQLRASAVNVAVTSIPEVEIKNDSGNPVPVSGALSLTGSVKIEDAVNPLLRATVDSSGRIAVNTGLSQPLTDSQLRASAVVTIDPITYYATAAGGRLAFNITTQIVSIAAAGEQPLAALVNPALSGKDIYLDVGEFGASMNTTFRRYRNPTVTPTGTAISGSNMGGGTATSVAQMYVGGTAGGTTPTYTRTGGTVAKTAHIAAYQQYLTEIKGKVVLRPGQAIAWTITASSAVTAANPLTAAVFFEYYELTAL